MRKFSTAQERAEVLDKVAEMAEGYQFTYGGCAQNVLIALQQQINLPGGPLALKSASYAGLGIARMGDLCGALFGAIIALGLASGRDNFKDAPYPEPQVLDPVTGNPKSLEDVRRFYKRFVSEFGSSTCHEIHRKLLGKEYDLGVPSQFNEFRESCHERCSELVGKTARMVAETILAMPSR